MNLFIFNEPIASNSEGPIIRIVNRKVHFVISKLFEGKYYGNQVFIKFVL
jgi:hypothetical protein